MMKVAKLRKLTILIIGIVAVNLLFIACKSASERYINSFESFVSDVEDDASNFSKKDWELNDMEFENFTNEKYERVAEELTANDKKKVGELSARYYKVRAKSYVENLIDAIEDGLNYIEGFANGILNDNNE